MRAGPRVLEASLFRIHYGRQPAVQGTVLLNRFMFHLVPLVTWMFVDGIDESGHIRGSRHRLTRQYPNSFRRLAA